MDCTSFGSYGTELIAKICYPSGSAVAFIFDIGLEIGEEWMADVATTYPATIGVFVVSIIFSVIFLVLTKAFTKCMVWSSIVLHLVFLVGLGVLTYEMAEDPHFASEITDYSMFLDPTYLRVISYILWGIAAISLIFMLCSIKKIGTAVRVIKKSTKLLADEPSIILVPISISFILVTLQFNLDHSSGILLSSLRLYVQYGNCGAMRCIALRLCRLECQGQEILRFCLFWLPLELPLHCAPDTVLGFVSRCPLVLLFPQETPHLAQCQEYASVSHGLYCIWFNCPVNYGNI